MLEPSPHHFAHALCVFAEPLVVGRRVVVVGDAELALGARLLALGARLVHVYDPDAGRAHRAALGAERGEAIFPFPDGDFAVREGAFDVALVPDVGELQGPSSVLARLRRLLGEGGCIVAAVPNPEVVRPLPGRRRAIDYYELYDLVALQFAEVRMVGEVPFVGVTLAELGEGREAPQVRVDTQLAEDSPGPVHMFLAVGSQRPLEVDPYVVIQLPPSPPTTRELEPMREASRAEPQVPYADPHAYEAPATIVQELRDEADDARISERAALAEAILRAELLGAQLAELKEEQSRGRDDARALDERLVAVARERDELARALEEERRVRQRLEQELIAARRNPELATAKQRVAALEESLHQAEAALHAWEERFAVVQAEAVRTTQQLVELSGEITRMADAHALEIAQFEAALRDRAQALQALEAELVRRERIVHELVSAVEDARDGREDEAAAPWAREAERARAEAEAARRELSQKLRELHAVSEGREAAQREVAELRARLDALALDAARREGDLQAESWRVAELTQRLAFLEEDLAAARAAAESEAQAQEASPPPPPGGASPEDVARMAQELDVLRQALAQEHQALARVQSGEALVEAQAEIERQSVLIHQLTQRLAALGAELPAR